MQALSIASAASVGLGAISLLLLPPDAATFNQTTGSAIAAEAVAFQAVVPPASLGLWYQQFPGDTMAWLPATSGLSGRTLILTPASQWATDDPVMGQRMVAELAIAPVTR